VKLTLLAGVRRAVATYENRRSYANSSALCLPGRRIADFSLPNSGLFPGAALDRANQAGIRTASALAVAHGLEQATPPPFYTYV